MTLMRIAPFNELDRVFDRFWGEPFGVSAGENGTSLSPSVDISETEEALVFSIEVPGLEKDDLEISVDGGVLSVTGEKRFESDESRSFLKRELRYGKIFRSFRLPRTVDPDGIKAGLKNGILTLTVPRREEAKRRQISVKVN